MIVKNPRFVISAVSKKQYPDSNLLEIAFCGRSNAGKSSLLNALTNRKKLAYVGATPGKTRQINFYNLDDEVMFVDLPGYGYAAVSKSEQGLWGKVISEYLNVRPQLYLIIMLVDIRHKPSKDDLTMYNWILNSGVSHIIVATKSDKIPRSRIPENVKIIRETLGASREVSIIPVSSETRRGIEELWNAIDSYIVEEDETNEGGSET